MLELCENCKLYKNETCDGEIFICTKCNEGCSRLNSEDLDYEKLVKNDLIPDWWVCNKCHYTNFYSIDDDVDMIDSSDNDINFDPDNIPSDHYLD